MEIKYQGDISKCWNELNATFMQRAISFIQNNFEVYLRAEALNDPYIGFLKKAGLRLEENNIKFPTLFNIFDVYQQVCEDNKRQGLISTNNCLKFGIPFRLVSGEPTAVAVGEPVPSGATVIASRLLSVEDYISLVRQGYFPVSLSLDLSPIVPLITMEHDVSHLISFALYPSYTEALVNAVRALSIKDLQNSVNMSERLRMAVETLVGIPKEKFKKVLSLFPDHITDSLEIADVTQVMTQLMVMSNDDLMRIGKTLLKDANAIVEYYGGTSQDIVYRLSSRYKGESRYFIDLLKQIDMTLTDSSQNKSAIARALARFLVAGSHAANISLNEWLAEMLKNEIAEDSKLAKFMLQSGVWDCESYLYQIHSKTEWTPRNNREKHYTAKKYIGFKLEFWPMSKIG